MGSAFVILNLIVSLNLFKALFISSEKSVRIVFQHDTDDDDDDDDDGRSELVT